MDSWNVLQCSPVKMYVLRGLALILIAMHLIKLQSHTLQFWTSGEQSALKRLCIVSTGARVWWRALQCSSLFWQHFLKISRHSRVCTKQMATYPSPPGLSDSEVCNQCSVLTFLRPFIHINAAIESWWR